MKIKFEDDNIYGVTPLNMANEIIDALANREHSSFSFDEEMNHYLNMCKTIEFLEMWRRQNQPRIEKELGYSKME